MAFVAVNKPPDDPLPSGTDTEQNTRKRSLSTGDFNEIRSLNQAKRSKQPTSSKAVHEKRIEPIKHRPLHPIAGRDWSYTGAPIVVEKSKAKKQDAYAGVGMYDEFPKPISTENPD